MLVLLDNGHGGLINGVYQTSGKQKDWGPQGVFYEGEFNRAIVNGIIEALTRLGIRYVNITPEYRDVTLQTRVNRANRYNFKDAFLVSVHANAGGGSGFEVYTSPGETKSDAIATVFGDAFQSEFPKEILRHDFSDFDLDKERRFFLLRKTKMPAVLTENFFMDNLKDFQSILNTKEGRERIVKYHVNAITRIQNQIF
ncbi:N-acetylmuramoyl-L-alanine amidase [Bizionia paragorgiae]|jgi:N-acetylmuramoyl-L-alanine amidase|uniref:N-acetylmuramoyl-L-alanine amidase n=1 Tax=Bizionia paragorgiae TaxID=283786 RepID=UPI00299E5D9D|nr:N-acetylmuramoyl-L-alanine amidase [Bizionia paragorgiae]MDX1272405.1 N-acetylmuramoyl-L-alanine amidase [Bizionia paragorgiae]